MSSNKTTRQSAGAPAPRVFQYDSLRLLDEALTLRSLAPATREEYHRYVRKLGERAKCDPATLDETQVRAHLLRLKEVQRYSASTMRSGCAALQFFFRHVVGRDWKLFDLVRCPDRQKLPAVLTREEVQRVLGAVRERRFAMILRLIYGCGLRIGEAVKLEVRDIQRNGKCCSSARPKAAKTDLCRWPRRCSPNCGNGGKSTSTPGSSSRLSAGAGASTAGIRSTMGPWASVRCSIVFG